MQINIQSLLRNLWIKAAAFGLVYFAGAWFSSIISFEGANLPTFWLPSGLLIAVLLLYPVAEWPAYMAASLPAGLAYSLLAPQPFANSMLLVLITLLEASTGAWLIRRFEDSPGRFHSPKNVFNVVVYSALGSTALSAVIATTILAIVIPGLSYSATWRLNWISHMLGVLVAAPLALAWADPRDRYFRRIGADKAIELVLLATGLTISCLYISVGSSAMRQQNYLVIPFLIWAALRFGPRGISGAGLIVTTIAIWGEIYHLDGFAINDATIDPTMRALGSFLVITLVTSYIITALWEQGHSVQTALQDSETRYRLLIENQGEGMAIIDDQETFTFANPAAEQIYGVAHGGLVGKKVTDFTNPEQYARIIEQTGLRQNHQKTTYEVEIMREGLNRRTLRVSATPQTSPEGEYSGAFIVFHDMTEQKMIERTLRESRSRYQVLFDSSPIPTWEEDFSRIKRLVEEYRRSGVEDLHEFLSANPTQLEILQSSIRILDVNKAAMQEFGFSDKAEFLTHAPKMLTQGPYTVFIEEVVAISEGRTEFWMEGPNDVKDGITQYHSVRWSVAPGHEHDYKRVIVSIMDMTERKQAEEQMRYLSTHDVLTGLYNRNFFEAELERLQNSRLEPTNLMMVDVNEMKMTNDTFGHAAGDELLRRTAQVLRLSFRKEDIIARIGGDEFVILFHGNVALDEAVKRVKDCLEEHNSWYAGPPLSLAIGTASGGKDNSLIALFKKADQLMYKEKVRMGKVRADGKTQPGDSPPGI